MIEHRTANTIEKAMILQGIPTKLLSSLSRFKAFIGGGSLLSTLYNIGSLKDYDLYFRNEHDAIWLEDFLDSECILQSKTSNANTWISRFYDSTVPIQTVKVHFGPPEQVLESFDLGICKIGYDVSSNLLYHDSEFFNHLSYKTTSVSGYDRPASTVFRVLKYMEKGFKPDIMDMTRLGIVVSAFSEDELMNGFDKGYYSPYTETTGLALQKYPELKRYMRDMSMNSLSFNKGFLSQIVGKIMESL
jgi:hypothetical protein